MSEGFEIIEANVLDLDAVMEVMNDAFDPCYGEAWTAAQCAGVLSLPGSLLLLARYGPQSKGFALLRSVADEAELLLIAVHPDSQGEGVGRQLVDKSLEIMAQKQVKIVHLEVRKDNPALSFYNLFDFREVGRRRDYYRGTDGQLTDAITLSRKLG